MGCYFPWQAVFIPVFRRFLAGQVRMAKLVSFIKALLIHTFKANNVAPSSKRAVSMALLISVGNFGAVVGSNVYIEREAPKYQTGFGVCFAFVGAGFIMTLILRYAYSRENKTRDELVASLGGAQGVLAKYSEQELLDMGDMSPFFRYTL